MRRVLITGARVRIFAASAVCVFACFVCGASAADDSHHHSGPSAQSYDAAKASLDQRLAPLRAAMKSIDWPAETPQEIGRLLKGEPGACAAFIVRSIRFEPYKGILRSGNGVLSAGGGNSADIALLLRELIKAGASPPPMRFAIADLSDEQAKSLVDRASKVPPARAAIAVASPTTAPTIADAAPTEISQTEDVLQKAMADLKQVQSFLPKDLMADRNAAIDATRQHVWLQVQRDGKWLSFDPPTNVSLPTDGVKTVDELPMDWQHLAKLNLEVERLQGGKLVRASLLQQQWPVAALSGNIVELMLVPAELPIEKMLDTQSGAKGIVEQAAQFKTFSPSLNLGADAKGQIGSSFDLSGKPGATQTKGAMGLGAVDPFGRTHRVTEAASDLSGVWLTITLIDSTGERKIERALLDRIGPAARSADKPAIREDWKDERRVRLALLQRHRILIDGGALSFTRIARETLTCIAEEDVLQEALAIKYQQARSNLSKLIAKLSLPTLDAQLVQIHNGSASLAQAYVAGRGIAFISRPNVAIRSETFDLHGKDLLMRNGIDLAVCDVRVLGDTAPASRSMHGLLASEMEAAAVIGQAGDRTLSAVDVLRAATEQKVAMKVLSNPGDVAAVEAGADVKAVMSAQLKAGSVLIAPAQPVPLAGADQIAWWRIDSDGQVLAIGSDGRGQAASEGEMVLTDISVPMVRNCMKFVACFNRAVAGGAGMSAVRADCIAEQIEDNIKESLDGSIKTFVNKATQKPGGKDKAYNEMYEKVGKAYEAYAQFSKMNDVDPVEIPGFNEGQAAANAGKAVGQALGFRVYLMLTMGRDIAQYASGL